MSPRTTPENRIPDIVRAAFRVFSTKGYRKTRMEEIAVEAGVSKGTLYYYFTSKAQLLHYLLENGIVREGDDIPSTEESSGVSEWDIIEYLGQRLRSSMKMEIVESILSYRDKGNIDIEKELKDIVGEMWDMIEKNRIMIILVEQSQADIPGLAKLFNIWGRGMMIDMFEEYLKSRTELSAIRPLSFPALISRMLVETVNWFGLNEYRHGDADSIPRDDLVNDLASLLARGLRPDQ
ncbi:MAG: TetR/AcrR family transcriptional regulator [Deltaproteobacteria bacterium]|uniref:TetR/AcrR family transcriptional regulator n=1 Tax=Candidatus Zymogenus saltonus TaxID=2844893 RepID=A0A9D8KG52_9DELT|nr:TetR/AcrR family transcriptional regulator [Candidatus Zymogenus saltonus]